MADSEEPLVITRKKSSIPVVVKDEETGTESRYFIRKINGHMRATYLNKVRTKTQMIEGGGFTKDFTGQFSDLLSLCLFAEGGNLPVSPKDVEAMDADVAQALWLKAMDYQGFTPKGEDEAKNV